MATVYCDNCGTSLLEETAKFCRACGKPTPLSEAATRRFDERPPLDNPTSPVGSFTTPAYMAPLDIPPGQETNDLRQKKQKRNLIILISMLAVMIFALVGLLAFLSFGLEPSRTAPPPPPPLGGTVPAPPPIPPVPPIPPAPGAGVPTAIDASLIYPGSAEETSIDDENGKKFLRLRSDDRTTKVVDWYMSKLKVAKRFSLAGQTILKAGQITVVIVGGDDGSDIMITRGDGD